VGGSGRVTEEGGVEGCRAGIDKVSSTSDPSGAAAEGNVEGCEGGVSGSGGG
jgi:hypothetical protein